MRPAGAIVLALAFLATSATGCLTRQRDEMVEAREAYQRCVRENPEDHERKCAALEAESITRQERYEQDARRSWGCAGSDEPNCDPRRRDR